MGRAPVDNVRMRRFSHVVYVDVQCQQLRQEKVDIVFTEIKHAITCNNDHNVILQLHVAQHISVELHNQLLLLL